MIEDKIEELKNRRAEVNRQSEILEKEKKPSDKMAKLSPQNIVKNAVSKMYPHMEEMQKNAVSKNILSLDSSVKIKVDGVEHSGDDFVFSIAERIDQIDAGVSRQNEYHEVIDDAKDIVDSMACGFTEEELKTRNEFIEHTIQREAEIITCLALYASSKSPKAKVKIAEMQKRLLRIREGRSAVINGTKSTADKAEEQIKQDKANGTYDENKVFMPNIASRSSMLILGSALANYDKLNDDDKKRHGFYHGTLEEVAQKNSPERCLSMVESIMQRTSYIEEMSARESSAERIARLSGVRGQVFGSKEKVIVSQNAYNKPLTSSRMNNLLNNYNQGR